MEHDSPVRSSAPLQERRAGQVALTALFCLIAVSCLLVGDVALAAWGLLGFGVDAVAWLCGAVALLGLGVVGARRTIRGGRPWRLLAASAAVVVVIFMVSDATRAWRLR
jgi:hypothetical protein